MLLRCLLLMVSLAGQIGACAQGIQVVNAGIGGENSAEVKARFHSAVTSNHATFVVIYVGMNDAVNERKFLPIRTSMRNIDWMRKDALDAGATAILVNVQHVDAARVRLRHDPKVYGAEGPNGRVDAFDAALEKLAAKRRIRLVDLRALVDDAGGAAPRLSTDGVHFNRAGYSLLAKAVYAALRPHLAAGATVLCIGDSLTYGVGVRPIGASERAPAGNFYPTYPAQLAELISGGERK
jgi:acyl-CoA thioesterase-1